ncbi:hypothetical protein N7540_003544 [Penicillium herquei]|nr:hypothetical protein N7540_003544 [Penicillium herquei]
MTVERGSRTCNNTIKSNTKLSLLLLPFLSLASSSNNIFYLYMDYRRSLEKSPPGPWTSYIESKATPLPII